jgi:DNA-directed RNA polymerase subunit RPC12/RpoP
MERKVADLRKKWYNMAMREYYCSKCKTKLEKIIIYDRKEKAFYCEACNYKKTPKLR